MLKRLGRARGQERPCSLVELPLAFGSYFGIRVQALKFDMFQVFLFLGLRIFADLVESSLCLPFLACILG